MNLLFLELSNKKINFIWSQMKYVGSKHSQISTQLRSKLQSLVFLGSWQLLHLHGGFEQSWLLIDKCFEVCSSKMWSKTISCFHSRTSGAFAGNIFKITLTHGSQRLRHYTNDFIMNLPNWKWHASTPSARLSPTHWTISTLAKKELP